MASPSLFSLSLLLIFFVVSLNCTPALPPFLFSANCLFFSFPRQTGRSPPHPIQRARHLRRLWCRGPPTARLPQPDPAHLDALKTAPVMCFRCGEEGHKIGVCPQPPKCLHCGKEVRQVVSRYAIFPFGQCTDVFIDVFLRDHRTKSRKIVLRTQGGGRRRRPPRPRPRPRRRCPLQRSRRPSQHEPCAEDLGMMRPSSLLEIDIDVDDAARPPMRNQKPIPKMR
jgi:hypothetical protein